MNDPIPLEVEQPELAEHFRLISNLQHPVVKALNIDPVGSTIFLKNRSFKRVNVLQPNDLCWCSSGRKYKKCHASISELPLICTHCHKRVEAVKHLSDTTTCRCYDPKPMALPVSD